MVTLRIGDNIAQQRKKRGITQDELADFLGITKASVSKWETRQSYPDVMMLPQIATYFDMTIDELMGYEPQLNREQIQKYYHELAADFANQPFEKVMEKSEDLVRKYYSCYPFLLQIAILWTNHFMLVENPDIKTEVMMKIQELCKRIEEESGDTTLQSDAVAVKALIDLQLGNYQAVIDTLDISSNPGSYRKQVDSFLVQAYLMSGNTDKAELYNQIFTYTHLLLMVQNQLGILCTHMQDKAIADETIKRVDGVIALYDLEHLNANLVAQYQYAVAQYYIMNGKNEDALICLSTFARLAVDVVKNAQTIHDDRYFTRLSDWYEEFALGNTLPRSKKVILESVITALQQPIFDSIRETQQFKSILLQIKENEI